MSTLWQFRYLTHGHAVRKYFFLRRKYSQAPVFADSVSAAYRGPKKKTVKLREKTVHKFQNARQVWTGRNMVKSSSPNAPSTWLIFLCPRTYAKTSYVRDRKYTVNVQCSVQYTLLLLYLTLSLLMSYIYGAPCKARNFNVVYIPIWTYVWQRWKPSISICCTMFQYWINAESFSVSQLCVNNLPATKITLIRNGIKFGSLRVNVGNVLLCVI
jgi:hypothetical protein